MNNFLELEQSLGDTRPILVVSDFDHTLCHDYIPDASGNNLLAVMDEEIVRLCRLTPLVIATATRAIHPKTRQLYDLGLIPEGGTLITENGGVVLDDHGQILWSSSEKTALTDMHSLVNDVLLKADVLPKGARLVTKLGISIVIAQARNNDNQTVKTLVPDLQVALDAELPKGWTASISGRSLTIHQVGVSKVNALPHAGIVRSDHHMISMGDSQNDADILEAADVSISVGNTMSNHADLTITANPRSVAEILRQIGRLSQERRAK